MPTENFYSGSVYSTDPKYNSVFSKGNLYGNFTGYNINFSELSSALDARTANQLKETSEILNMGVKNIEVGNVQPNVFEAIPKEHFKEMNTQAKLAGAQISFHAPMIDPTGISENGWNKLMQESAEKQLWNAIKTSHALNPNNHVVTIHATSGFPAPAETKIMDENGKERIIALTVIDPTTGKVGQIKEEERYFGTKNEKPLEFKPGEELKRINEDSWMNTISNLNFSAQRGRQAVLDGKNHLKNNPFYQENKKLLEEIKKADPDQYNSLEHEYKEYKNEIGHGTLFLREAYNNTRRLFDEVYKNAGKEKQAELRKYADQITPLIEEYQKDSALIEKNPEKLTKFAEAIEFGINTLKDIKPEIYRPIKEFAVEKAAETTANLAWKGFTDPEIKKSGNAPIIALENHPANQGLLTTGEDLREVIKEAQKKFIEKATTNGISKEEAEKQAKKLIGATWDVGHINMLRRYGFGEKQILDQTEAIAPFIKKVHLADNFGFEHTELPMGMGNVPIKKIMEKIGKEGFDVKKVIEAGDYWQHFSQGSKAQGPLAPTLAGMGTYFANTPSWNQMYGIPGAYFSGYGTMLPDQHFQTYGAGFSPLPLELGGQLSGGKDSRFSGAPMA